MLVVLSGQILQASFDITKYYPPYFEKNIKKNAFKKEGFFLWV